MTVTAGHTAKTVLTPRRDVGWPLTGSRQGTSHECSHF